MRVEYVPWPLHILKMEMFYGGRSRRRFWRIHSIGNISMPQLLSVVSTKFDIVEENGRRSCVRYTILKGELTYESPASHSSSYIHFYRATRINGGGWRYRSRIFCTRTKCRGVPYPIDFPRTYIFDNPPHPHNQRVYIIH